MTSVFRPSAHALITGGASGIGLAVAELCLSHSMKVTIADFNQETLDLAQKNLTGDVTCVKVDVGDKQAWKGLKERVGEVDFLMLNAGVGGKGGWGDEEYFEKVRPLIPISLNSRTGYFLNQPRHH
jgi:NADP-dependent 3-hydroxy acid dehydrogenase YdfG